MGTPVCIGIVPLLLPRELPFLMSLVMRMRMLFRPDIAAPVALLLQLGLPFIVIIIVMRMRMHFRTEMAAASAVAKLRQT